MLLYSVVLFPTSSSVPTILSNTQLLENSEHVPKFLYLNFTRVRSVKNWWGYENGAKK